MTEPAIGKAHILNEAANALEQAQSKLRMNSVFLSHRQCRIEQLEAENSRLSCEGERYRAALRCIQADPYNRSAVERHCREALATVSEGQ